MTGKPPPNRIPNRLTAAAAAALTAAVLVPCVTPSTPAVYFDTDPRLGGELGVLRTALGPVGMAGLQFATALLALVGIAVARWAGGRIVWWAVALTGLGIAAAAWHAFKPGARWEDWTQAGAWISAAMAGLGALHLARFDAARRWIVALLIAAAVPLLAEAVWQTTVEHAANLRHFEANRAEILARQGIEPGSQQAELFERRARLEKTTGVFRTSNLLASVSGALGVTGLALALLNRRDKRARRRGVTTWPAAACGLGGLAVVALTGSKGAALAVVASGLLLGAVVLVGRRPRWTNAVPIVAVSLVALAFGGVLVRGALGPPDSPAGGFQPGEPVAGERSILFRAQYWSASAKIAAEHPLLGSGARGFADAYPRHKDPLNPETVTSAHSVFVDQVAMLGVGGWAWSALLLGWLWIGARAAAGSAPPGDEATPDPATDTEPAERGFDRASVWTAAAAALLIFGINLAVRRETMYLDTALLWLTAAAGLVAVAAWLAGPGRVTARSAHVGLLTAATLVLVHNQIEMAFFQPESMGVLWLIVGAAAGAGLAPPKADGRPKRGGAWLPRSLAATLGVGVLITAGVLLAGAVRHENAMAGADAALRRGDTALAVERLAGAQQAAGTDTNALRWRARLYAVEPLDYFFATGQQAEARARVESALGWIDSAIGDGPAPPTLARLRAQVLDRLSLLSNEPDDQAAADEAYRQTLEASPYNVQDALAWADLAVRAGQWDQARERYGRVRDLREQSYLDPADPLTAEQWARVQAFLNRQSP